MSRFGNNSFNEKFIRQVKGLKPTAPMYLVEHDDNNLDFLFQDATGYRYHKYVGIFVKDSFNGLLLGKSYIQAQSPVQEQVYHAYLDAMYYIRSLTGGWYLPFEIKADKWASASLKPFYTSLAKFIPPSHGNKHRGYIEQSFGSHHWKRAQQLVSQGINNWSGNNITAGNRGVNTEVLNGSKKDRPMIGKDAELQIENFCNVLRKMPDFKRGNMNAPSKEQQWLESFSKLTEEQKRPITEEQFFQIFGVKHNTNRTISITNRGVEPQINGVKYSYDLPEPYMYNQLIGSSVNMYYDPFDMSRVLVTNEKDIRFIAKAAQLTPRALQDACTNSRTYLNAILSEKKDQVNQVASKSNRRALATDSIFNPEALLQGGVLAKELKNRAENYFLNDLDQPFNPLDLM
jgi:hypothetical protein